MGGYALVTLHRPSNVDDREQLAEILGALEEIAEERPVVFPVHPRTRARMREFGLDKQVGGRGLRLLDPVSYLEMLALQRDAAVVLTDSGGIQEETTVLGVPCLTLRNTTERPITITEGTNRLVPVRSREKILEAYREAVAGMGGRGGRRGGMERRRSGSRRCFGGGGGSGPPARHIWTPRSWSRSSEPASRAEVMTCEAG